MERIAVSNTQNIISNGDYIIDGLLLAGKEVNIEIEVNSTCDILLNNIKDITNLKITINRDCNVLLSFLTEDEMKESNIEIIVKNNATLSTYFADFAEKTLNLHCKVRLVEEGATCYCKVASLVADQDKKVIDISLDHDSPRTHGKFNCYGICKDSGKILVAGCSHMKKGSVKSDTQQNCKIMVFDEACDASAKPILKN